MNPATRITKTVTRQKYMPRTLALSLSVAVMFSALTLVSTPTDAQGGVDWKQGGVTFGRDACRPPRQC